MPIHGPVDGERALELADEALGRLDLDSAMAHLSAATRAFTASGESRRAAMVCIRLGDLLATMMGNLTASRAWFARAWRLVESEPPCVEQGWVAVAAMGCDVDDPAELLESAELALERARRFADVNLETKALADGGLARVQSGQIAEGMDLLDEAMALACGPADDRDTAAKSVCSFFTACYFAADFERAGTWAGMFRRHGLISMAPGGPVFLSSHCDTVQASLLLELGQWGEAERILTGAKTNFETVMQVPAWHPDIALADLRVRQGRFADAETLLIGKDGAIEALLPAARMHLARGDHDLARAACLRGLRVMGADHLRAVGLLTTLVDAELARGDTDAATAACEQLTGRTRAVGIDALQGRTSAARARVLAARGDVAGAIACLEEAVDDLDANRLPWLHAVLLLDLAALRETSGDTAGATIDAKAAAAILAALDVVVAPEARTLLDRLVGMSPGTDARSHDAVLRTDGKWCEAVCAGTSVRLRDTKGLRYLAELVARPGVERHVLDLVDTVEGVPAGDGPDRRALGDAGEVLDSRARAAYRHRIEELRSEIDDSLATGTLELAEAKQEELDTLVHQLAQAFGLGGRDRRAASAAERARLNVTRAIRAATARLTEALPDAGAVLDRRVRTGLYCIYEPEEADPVRWSTR